MCEYCEKGKALDVEYESAVCEDKGFVLSERIESNKIFILANLGFINKKGKIDYTSTLSIIRIDYCPMCGRRLGE